MEVIKGARKSVTLQFFPDTKEEKRAMKEGALIWPYDIQG